MNVTQADADARLIRRGDMVACRLAFIDCKMPGSELKENYSLIGPGVTQSADQVVNLTEPHGFSLGVAAMPPGTVNNLHIHYTAEVFMVHTGTWEFRWGSGPHERGGAGTIVGRPGDVVSMPTWIFRGFTNIGPDRGWIFTALGGDDTGGIIWHPSILAQAADHGLYLTRENMMVDSEQGAPKPEDGALMPPLTGHQLALLRSYTKDEIAARVVTTAERAWSSRALLDSCLPGHASELAPALGYGISQDLEQSAKVTSPHGFSIDWLRLAPGQSVSRHAIAAKQVAILFRGSAGFVLNEDGGVRVQAAEGECFSTPADAWRSVVAGPDGAEMALVTAGDGRKRVTWPDATVREAASHGWGLDHAGYIAPAELLPAAMMIAAE